MVDQEDLHMLNSQMLLLLKKVWNWLDNKLMEELSDLIYLYQEEAVVVAVAEAVVDSVEAEEEAEVEIVAEVVAVVPVVEEEVPEDVVAQLNSKEAV